MSGHFHSWDSIEDDNVSSNVTRLPCGQQDYLLSMQALLPFVVCETLGLQAYAQAYTYHSLRMPRSTL